MDVIYKIGIVIGIIVVYCLVTLGIAVFSTLGNEFETGLFFGVAWVVGVLAFLVLMVTHLDDRGMWEIQTKPPVAIETEIQEGAY